ncbi:hypothetical protein PFI31113_02370 [Pandoraea fibrosis]|uniref:Uncharacterized protein n=1 Tax=Pandoraea fibrosis TaxID=1891094 RepID=A0A5E4V375_9BURK|nr:hypothetical protein PFI31113_02370 [Pandoraea fibrosis]
MTAPVMWRKNSGGCRIHGIRLLSASLLPTRHRLLPAKPVDLPLCFAFGAIALNRPETSGGCPVIPGYWLKRALASATQASLLLPVMLSQRSTAALYCALFASALASWRAAMVSFDDSRLVRMTLASP